MNSRVTNDNQVYEYHMPRERYRDLLIASRMPKAPHYYDLDEPIGLWDAVKLATYAGGMLALLGYGLMWILG